MFLSGLDHLVEKPGFSHSIFSNDDYCLPFGVRFAKKVCPLFQFLFSANECMSDLRHCNVKFRARYDHCTRYQQKCTPPPGRDYITQQSVDKTAQKVFVPVFGIIAFVSTYLGTSKNPKPGVIPAEAGIQRSGVNSVRLDSGFRRNKVSTNEGYERTKILTPAQFMEEYL